LAFFSCLEKERIGHQSYKIAIYIHMEVLAMEKQKWGISGLVFVGCMFLGGGIGSLLGNTQTGWLLGMGVGFLGMAITRVAGK
jgi:hypothetical protein